MHDSKLIELAMDARVKAYAPYSQYKVGAVVLSENGNIFVGCNVENAAYGVASCAEAGALSAMIAAGDKVISKILIVGGAQSSTAFECTPCGACRQRIAEFSNQQTIIGKVVGGETVWRNVDTLLPDSFGPRMLSTPSFAGR